MNKIIVGISDLKVSKAPGMLVTFGLGSCIGIVLHDKKNKITGMVHIMLYDSKKVSNNSNPAKFADTGIKALLNKMIVEGADKRYILAKIAGGANMFSGSQKADLKIGENNYVATKKELSLLKIPIVGEDCGKNYGRTLEADVMTGEVLIKTIAHGTKYL